MKRAVYSLQMRRQLSPLGIAHAETVYGKSIVSTKKTRRSTVKSLDYDWMIVTVSVYGLKDTRWDEYGSLAVYPSC